MTSFRVNTKDSKSYSIYMEDGGRYYVMHVNWNEKYGLHIANGKKRISKQSYLNMMAQVSEVEIVLG